MSNIVQPNSIFGFSFELGDSIIYNKCNINPLSAIVNSGLTGKFIEAGLIKYVTLTLLATTQFFFYGECRMEW